MKQLLFFSALVIGSCFSFGQTQIGLDIDGEAADDQSGISVSMPDAYTIAIGATRNDGNGADAGHVRIYEWNGSNWSQKGLDIDGEAAEDQSGFSVSMPDANIIAIGAVGNDANGSYAGHVRIFEWSGTAWTQKGLDIDGEAADDQSGYSVSMPNANTVAIGANGNDANGSYAGHVRIYQWNGSTWTQKGLDIDGEAAGDQSGYSVSMPNANTVAIGANGNDGNGNFAGHVRIYQWNGSTWNQKGLDIDGETAYDFSGRSVSMPDTNTVAIGADGNDGNGVNAGHVRIYKWNGSDWVQRGLDIEGEVANNSSGHSVSMPDSNTIAIGAVYNSGVNGVDAGHVRIYQWTGSAWAQKGIDIDGEAVYDYSGWSISMPNANTIAIGAPYNYGNGSNAGHVRIYEVSNYFNKTITITACDSLVSPSGDSVWYTSGTYYDTLVDTAYVINLTVNSVDIILAVDSNVRCYGDSNGGATVSILPPYNGPYTFIWNTTDTTLNSSIINQPAGELFVKVVDAFGCYKSDTVTITQPDSLTVGITLDSNVSCNGTADGGATALHHGGNSPYNYSWSNGGNSPTITNVPAGTYTVTVTDYWGCTPAVDSITIIKLNPSSVTIYETVCDSLVSPSGNYTWTATGIYKDTILNAVGCDSVMTFDLTVNHPSASTDSKTICQGDSIIIGGNWYYNDTIVNDTLTNSKLCDSVITITVTKVSPSPINLGVDTSICHNDSITISAGVYDSYLWSNGDTTASIVVKGSVVGVGSNNYWVEASDINGCISKDTITVTINQCSNAGINEALIHNLIAIYPNPITEQSFTINFNSYEEDCIIEVVDISGKIIKRINRQNKSIVNVNLTTEKGIYFVKFISQNNEIGVAKIVKQ